MARQPRILYHDKSVGSIYHCVSRTVNKEFLWDDEAKEIFRRQIWKCAAFSGVEILAYCIMSNHFHLLVRVISGHSSRLTNEELIERAQRFYSHPRDAMTLARLEAELRHPDERIQLTTRNLLLARMDDLPCFMKILKQRFSIWYNHKFERWGTHWGERYRSVLVEHSSLALRVIAAYIALNPVRAGICADPKDYRFNSYQEAVNGNPMALAGILLITQCNQPKEALKVFQSYLGRLADRASPAVPQAVTTADATTNAVGDGDNSPSSPVVGRQKARCFSHGLALGSKNFLDHLASQHCFQLTRRTKQRKVVESSSIFAMRI